MKRFLPIIILILLGLVISVFLLSQKRDKPVPFAGGKS